MRWRGHDASTSPPAAAAARAAIPMSPRPLPPYTRRQSAPCASQRRIQRRGCARRPGRSSTAEQNTHTECLAMSDPDDCVEADVHRGRRLCDSAHRDEIDSGSRRRRAGSPSFTPPEASRAEPDHPRGATARRKSSRLMLSSRIMSAPASSASFTCSSAVRIRPRSLVNTGTHPSWARLTASAIEPHTLIVVCSLDGARRHPRRNRWLRAPPSLSRRVFFQRAPCPASVLRPMCDQHRAAVPPRLRSRRTAR